MKPRRGALPYCVGVLREQLSSPTPVSLAAFLNGHVRSCDVLVQVVAECEVEYAGRALSTADAGCYVVMVKCDGSLQIHGARGVKPVNWQPRTDDVSAFVEEGRCVLVASRRSPEEVVKVTFHDVHLALALELEEAGFTLSGSEKDMQEALARSPHVIEQGLTVLDRELLVGVGGIDLYALDRDGRLVVVELKRARAGHEAVHQLARYVAAVRLQVPHREVRGILAAPSVTAPAREALTRQGLEFVEVTALAKSEPAAMQGALF
ncbi:hypothetical protein DES52_105260 [Deinococcus yavapaiensis KR-236]|uniref:Endonuclease NucS n=1 Tax=Deinococcus yavapaiensis KR-236 TaxID=694435 RepID=A0A318SPE4_9DEIO|nr:hypothetical protein DES52_105260 [Deinococcus yavapaiensis KR-236]